MEGITGELNELKSLLKEAEKHNHAIMAKNNKAAAARLVTVMSEISTKSWEFKKLVQKQKWAVPTDTRFKSPTHLKKKNEN